jgi:hypothetical protein
MPKKQCLDHISEVFNSLEGQVKTEDVSLWCTL